MDKYVYHSSPRSGLKKLTPNISTHNESWVYATKDKLMSAAFLGREGGDYTCQVGRDAEGKIYITERFEGAFDLRYNVSGSIYKLSSTGFKEGKTTWSEEVVSINTVDVIDEEYIPDARKYLLQLSEAGRIIISKFPEKYMVKADDSDLVDKAKRWITDYGQLEHSIFAKYHPHLAQQVKTELEKEKK